MLGGAGHLSHRLNLGEGDVTVLGSVKQRAGIHGPGERGDGVHDQIETAHQFLQRTPHQLNGGSKSFLDHPLQQAGGVGRESDQLPAGASRHDLVSPDPVERSLALRHLGVGQHVVEPVLEQQLLDAGADGLVHGNVDVLAGSIDPRGAHSRQSADGGHEAAEVVRLSTPRVDRLVGQPRQGEDATEGGGNQVTGLPAGPWTSSSEGGQRDLDQPVVVRYQIGVVETEIRQRAGSLGLDDEVCRFRQSPVAGPTGVGRQVEAEAHLGTVVPPVEEPAPGIGVLGAHRRPWPAGSQLDHRRPGFREQLGSKAPAVVGEINHPKTLERALSHVFLLRREIQTRRESAATQVPLRILAGNGSTRTPARRGCRAVVVM